MNSSEALSIRVSPNSMHESQVVYRKLLECMSNPGCVERVDDFDRHPIGLFPATYAIALALLEKNSRIHLSPSLTNSGVIESMRFHSGIKFVETSHNADFVFCNEFDRPYLDKLKACDGRYTEETCTLIVQCKSFFRGIIYRVSGPGVKSSRKIRCSAFNGTLVHQRNRMSRDFRPGVDLILVCGSEFFCIPRTTRLDVDDY